MVRLAEESDVVGILKLVREHIHVVNIGIAEDSFSSNKTSQVIHSSILSNLCTVALVDEEIVGVCLGIGNLNVFCSNTFEIQLLVNVIKEEHRGTSLGGRNFIEWMAVVKAVCKDNKNIGGVWVGQQPKGTNIDFEKRGFKLSHTNWLMINKGDDDD